MTNKKTENEKNETPKIDPVAWLKSKIGMLPSRDVDQKLHCPFCRRRTLQANFSREKPVFTCTSCRRSALGLWDFMRTFDAYAPKTLVEAKARLDSAGVDYNSTPDEVIFQSDVESAQRVYEQEKLQARIEARRTTQGVTQ